MPGYMGYVPRQEEFKLGGRYGQWTRFAYGDLLRSIKADDGVAPDRRHSADIGAINL